MFETVQSFVSVADRFSMYFIKLLESLFLWGLKVMAPDTEFESVLKALAVPYSTAELIRNVKSLLKKVVSRGGLDPRQPRLMRTVIYT